jgi:hypothetical protein
MNILTYGQMNVEVTEVSGELYPAVNLAKRKSPQHTCKTMMEKRKIPHPCQKSNHNSLVVQPTASS